MPENSIKRLITCINRIDGKYYDIAKQSSAGENEIAVLYALSDGVGHSQKSICDEWLIPKTTVNTLTHKMLAEGLIEVSGISGKEKLLKLTAEGMTYAERVLAPMRAREHEAMKKTLEKYPPQFIDALEQFADYFIGHGEKNND